MTIEVTSVPDPRRISSFRRVARFIRSVIRSAAFGKHCLIYRLSLGLLLLASIVGGNVLLGSYKYYARIIDDRLASGYLTSRPGLYAAPRSIRVGQKLSPEQLVHTLRRAGYVESAGSDVWSGSFYQQSSAIEIRPSHTNKKQPGVVRIGFDGGKISDLTGDNLALESFTLEPEVLSNDLSSKRGKQEVLTYSEIPSMLAHAVLAIEDRRFFDHAGVDIAGLARAIFRNAGDERLGQGGSTITQQLVKNTYLSPERTFRRKYAEAMLATALERRLSKQDIFALYCNEVYLGQRGAVAARGVREAAHIFFGKELKDLTLPESATIAGMIQGPTRYSPLRHAEAAQARRDIVLEAMARDGWISADQAAAATKEAIVVAPPVDTDNSLAPYFVDYVNRIAESDFDASGASQRIYTTIDLELQQLAENALKHQLDRLDSVYQKRGLKPQAALVALDPRTGNVLAMVGGREYAESQLNRATDAHRQPGSTFKPFVYAAALEDGISPVQTFTDAPREFTYDHNRIYHPSNFGGRYSMRDVTMRTGLVKSLNVVTVDVAMRTGLARIANLAERFGLPKPERYPSLALGTKEVTPLQLAASYAVFVNDGRRVDPKVVAAVGEPPAMHSAANSQGDPVISPTTSYMITNMLSAVVDHGTARAARGAVKGTAIAGKTGTSRDGWFVGFTPNLVCVVWIGFDGNQQLGLTGAEAALPAWVDFVKEAIAVRPDLGGKNFECPEGIEFVEIDSDSGMLATLSCPNRELIAVTDRLAPNIECSVHGYLPNPASKPPGETQLASITETAQVRRATTKVIVSMELKTLRATRVDVDARGRRSLVNDMR